jgi:alpha-1,3-rhamnosyltransferase
MKPLVSFLIVSFNHEKFIKEAILSVIQQKYDNIELFVVDNCSHDKSSEIIMELKEIYKFEFIQQENIGVPRTLNKIIPRASGKYFTFFSGDDVLLPMKTKFQVDFMESNLEYGMCYGKTIFIDEKSKIKAYNINRKFRGGDIFKEIIELKFHPPAPTYLFRKEMLVDVGLYDEKLMLIEDLYMNIKLSRKYKIGFINEYLTYQRKHQGNLTTSIDFSKQIEESYRIFDNYTDLPNYKYLRKNLELHIFSFLADYDNKLTIDFMKKSLPFFYRKKFLKGFIKIMKRRK